MFTKGCSKSNKIKYNIFLSIYRPRYNQGYIVHLYSRLLYFVFACECPSCFLPINTYFDVKNKQIHVLLSESPFCYCLNEDLNFLCPNDFAVAYN